MAFNFDYLLLQTDSPQIKPCREGFPTITHCILPRNLVFYRLIFCIIAPIKPDTMAPGTIHEGRNIKRIREILGIKQETLATTLGLSQQAISNLEQKEIVDKDLLEKVAKAMKISPEAIKSFNEENTINIFSNTYHDNSSILGTYHFNPLDKMVELYEALLKSEREKIALLEKMLDKK
jgi:transcriptional regulator with XRE-family HTH domain